MARVGIGERQALADTVTYFPNLKHTREFLQENALENPCKKWPFSLPESNKKRSAFFRVYPDFPTAFSPFYDDCATQLAQHTDEAVRRRATDKECDQVWDEV